MERSGSKKKGDGNTDETYEKIIVENSNPSLVQYLHL